MYYYGLFLQCFDVLILITVLLGKLMHTHLSLFSTSYCHLCDLALVLIHNTLPHVQLQVVEISDNADLMQQYELKIPVLQNQQTKAVLNWPFTAEDILQLTNPK
jgi:hypothetical protein